MEDDSEIKELITLLITHYNNVRGDGDRTTSKNALDVFNRKNPHLKKTSETLWNLINESYAHETPSNPDNVQHFYDEYIKQKKGGRKLRSIRNRKRSQRRVRRRIRSYHISRRTMKSYDKN
jgi:hypothetical protein